VIYTTSYKEYRGGEIARGSYHFPLMSKGERNIKNMNTSGAKHEDKGIDYHRGSMSVAINAKGGDCWKNGFH
jgi:hypothetical protein